MPKVNKIIHHHRHTHLTDLSDADFMYRLLYFNSYWFNLFYCMYRSCVGCDLSTTNKQMLLLLMWQSLLK